MRGFCLWIIAGCLCLSVFAGAQSAHAKKKKHKAKPPYDYENSEYKAYHELTDTHHYRFDKDGNPLDNLPPPKKAADTKHKNHKRAGKPRAAVAARAAHYAPTQFPGSVNPQAPATPAAGAPPGAGGASEPAPMGTATACQGDTCSQAPASQPPSAQ